MILLDDCSTDNSLQVINSYKGHPKVTHVLINEENSGSTFKQWMKGIAASCGDLIWIAESDDVAEPDFLHTAVHSLLEHGSDLFFCNSTLIDSAGRQLKSYYGTDGVVSDAAFYNNFQMEGSEFIRRHMLHSNGIPNASAVVFKRSLMAVVTEDFQSYKVNGDWLFWTQLIGKGAINYHAKPLNYFRTHLNNVRSTTQRSGRYLVEMFTVQEYIASITQLDTVERRTLKYNMLHRMLSAIISGRVKPAPEVISKCLHVVDTVSPGYIFPIIRSLMVIIYAKFKKQ